jgi:uncharacterized membrane-anchored protein YitT (DUF2179 family)
MRLTKKELIQITKNIFLVIIGTITLAFGTAVFILPMNIVSGGVSGLSIIIKLLLPFEFITMDIIVFVLTWGLFFIGLAILGRAFALKTLLSTLIYPLAVSVFMRLADPSVLDGFFFLAEHPNRDLALILCASVGGVLVGLGCALTFIGGGSTGGVDIISFSICKFFPRLKSSSVIFVIDALTVIFGMFVIGDLVVSMLGILSAFVTAVMIDKVFLGNRVALVANIVTDRYAEINSIVIEKLDRTTTIVDVKGGFSNEDKKMLMVSVTMAQYAELLAIIGKVDPRAFVMIHRVHEVNGEGWSSLV